MIPRALLTLLVSLVPATFWVPSLYATEESKGQWSWGLGVFSSPDIYRDASPRTIPVPIIAYNSERLHIFGPFVAYDLYRHDKLTASLRLKPVFAGYDESDSPVFDGMDDRTFSLAGGAGLEYMPSFLKFRLSAEHDVLGINNGYESLAGVSLRLPLKGVLIEPGIALNYQSSNYVNYYYGVETSEAREGRPAYSPSGVLNQDFSVALATRKLFGGMTRFQITYTQYGDEIADSPLTDRDDSLGLSLTFGKTF